MKEKLSDSKFLRNIEKKVNDTVKKYGLFSRKDKLAVAVSGGKDSTVCLYILKKLGYDVEAITVDAVIGDYTKENVKNLKKVCKEHDIKLKVVSFRDEFGMALCYIQSLLKGKGYKYSSCMICGINASASLSDSQPSSTNSARAWVMPRRAMTACPTTLSTNP